LEMAESITVVSLHVYPIKGAAGFSPQRWIAEERGLRHDRRFMVASPDGRFITQREYPELARVRASIRDEALVVEAAGSSASCPASPTAGDRLRVRIWDDELDAIAPSADADRLLSAALRTSCRLVYQPEESRRLTAVKRGEPQRAFSFADAAPILVVAESAVDELNERLAEIGAEPVAVNRFRANIVLKGVPRGGDDHWSTLSIGAATMRLATRCKRCQVVTIDQVAGTRTGSEPLRTLGSYRREGDGIVFGRHAIVDAGGSIGTADVAHVA
jgi:uncharacterized protein